MCLCFQYRKEDNGWVKKCMEYEVEGALPTVGQRLCSYAHKLNREDAIDRNR